MKYASLVCRSPEAADRFIRLCETMADDLLRPYGYVLIALSTVLRIRRTLSGEEIDAIIATTVAGFEPASEQARRRRWQRVLERAAEFKTVSS
jgi:plasmid stabilization system protein ParE